MEQLNFRVYRCLVFARIDANSSKRQAFPLCEGKHLYTLKSELVFFSIPNANETTIAAFHLN